MSVFAIIHDEPRTEELTERIEIAFGSDDCYVISPTVLFLRMPDGDPFQIRTVARIGPEDEDGQAKAGLVVKLNATHSGFFRTDFWEWFREAREQNE